MGVLYAGRASATNPVTSPTVTVTQPPASGSHVIAQPSDSLEFADAAALSGAGALTAAGAPAFAPVVALGGSGTLTATGSPSALGTATLGGSGTLTTTGTPAIDPAVALTGAGALTASGAPSTAGSALLTGSGLLALAGAIPADLPVVSDPRPTIGGGAAPVTHHAPRAWRSRTEFADDDLELLVSGALSLDEWLVLTASEGP